MDLNFQFNKERGVGDLIQDFISLFRQIFKHYIATLLTLSLPLIGMIILLTFLATSQINDIEYFDLATTPAILFIGYGLALLVMVLFLGILCNEYMILLRDKNNTDFNYKTVLKSAKSNFITYITGGFVLFLFSLIIIIPVSIIYIILIFIPIIGGLAANFISMFLMIFYYCAFMLYREKKFGMIDAIRNTFPFLKKNWLNHTSSLFLFQFLLGIIMLILLIIPFILFFIIGFNSASFFSDFFTTYWGKIVISFVSGILSFGYILSIMINNSFVFLIYCSNNETKYHESVLESIQSIGQTTDEV